MFTTRSLNVMPETTEQHLIVRMCGKSKSEVTALNVLYILTGRKHRAASMQQLRFLLWLVVLQYTPTLGIKSTMPLHVGLAYVKWHDSTIKMFTHAK